MFSLPDLACDASDQTGLICLFCSHVGSSILHGYYGNDAESPQSTSVEEVKDSLIVLAASSHPPPSMIFTCLCV